MTVPDAKEPSVKGHLAEPQNCVGDPAREHGATGAHLERETA